MLFITTESFQMKRLIFIVLAVFLSAILSNAQPHLSDHYAPTLIPDRIMLTLTATPDTSMAVNWRTSLAVDQGIVQLALASPAPDFQKDMMAFKSTVTPLLTDRNGANYHSAVMTGLEPNKQYAYRVGNGTFWSEWMHFKTADSKDQPLSFLYFGDAQNELKSLWSRAIRGAYSKMPDADFMLHAGDLINRANSDHEWGEWFYAGGWVYGMMPSIATPGNHEYYRDE